jgi:fumarate hydratase class II
MQHMLLTAQHVQPSCCSVQFLCVMQKALSDKASEFESIIKIGRTCSFARLA